MIHLDTSALVAAFAGSPAALRRLRELIAEGERPGVSTMVLHEWWRGPRTRQELADQEAFLPSADAFPFGRREAEIAAGIYRELKGSRARSVDIAIAACAIAQNVALWTLNPRDFADIPGPGFDVGPQLLAIQAWPPIATDMPHRTNGTIARGPAFRTNKSTTAAPSIVHAIIALPMMRVGGTASSSPPVTCIAPVK